MTGRDAAGNAATCAFDVTVRDTVAPEVSCPADVAVMVRYRQNARVEFTLPTATDAVSAPVIGSSVDSGSLVAPGTTPVEVTATDAAGNTSHCTFQVTVNHTPITVEPQQHSGFGCAPGRAPLL